MLMLLWLVILLKSFSSLRCLLTISVKNRLAAEGLCFHKIRHCRIIITPIFIPRSSPDAEGLSIDHHNISLL